MGSIPGTEVPLSCLGKASFKAVISVEAVTKAPDTVTPLVVWVKLRNISNRIGSENNHTGRQSFLLKIKTDIGIKSRLFSIIHASLSNL